MNRQAFDKAVEILKTHPNHFFALRAIVIAGSGLDACHAGRPGQREPVSQCTSWITLDTAFAAANKPASHNGRAVASHQTGDEGRARTTFTSIRSPRARIRPGRKRNSPPT